MSAPGRSLELHFIDGRPDGMLTAEVFNWTGHVLRAPRTRIREALAREEARRTGVYLLLGEVEGRARLYIGEAEDIRKRLHDHVKEKDWWDQVILITTAGDALHKAHVKYLESRLVEIARDVAAADLENGNTPPRSSLSEAATANMEAFLETLMMVLPAIRVDVFLSRKRNVTPEPRDAGSVARGARDDLFEFRVKKHGLLGRAVLRDGEMVVLKGSTTRGHWAGARAHTPGSARRYDALLEQGVIDTSVSPAVFTQDYGFPSPSLADEMIAGRSANGRTSWIHTETGQTYAEWEAAQIERDDADDLR